MSTPKEEEKFIPERKPSKRNTDNHAVSSSESDRSYRKILSLTLDDLQSTPRMARLNTVKSVQTPSASGQIQSFIDEGSDCESGRLSNIKNFFFLQKESIPETDESPEIKKIGRPQIIIPSYKNSVDGNNSLNNAKIVSPTDSMINSLYSAESPILDAKIRKSNDRQQKQFLKKVRKTYEHKRKKEEKKKPKNESEFNFSPKSPQNQNQSWFSKLFDGIFCGIGCCSNKAERKNSSFEDEDSLIEDDDLKQGRWMRSSQGYGIGRMSEISSDHWNTIFTSVKTNSKFKESKETKNLPRKQDTARMDIPDEFL